MIASPTLHAVEIVPRAARPGDVVSVRFRARNHGPTPTPAATVRFVCDGALVPLGETSVVVAPAAPGDDLAATLEIRLPAGFDDGTRFRAHAVLSLPDRTLETNVATLTLRCRPAFDGSTCGATIEPLGSDGVRVVAAITNDGDGPAHDVTLHVAPPFGTRAREGSAGIAHAQRLDPGETMQVSLDAAIVEALDEFRADDVVVRTGDGAVWTVATRNALVPAAVLVARLEVRPQRRRCDLVVVLTNEGWADATDVPVRFTIPPPLRLVDGSLDVDGVALPARTRRKPAAGALARFDGTVGAPAIVVARVAARTACTVTLAVDVPCDDVTRAVAIDAGGTLLEAAVTARAQRDVRMRVVCGPGDAAPGAVAAFVAELVNLGDRPESLRLRTDDDWAADGSVDVHLAPGTIARVGRSVRVPDDAQGTVRCLALTLDGDAGEVARCERRFRVRATEAGAVPPDVEHGDDTPAVRVTVDAPSDVVSGASFPVGVSIEVLDAVEVLRVQARLEGARYAGGSTTIDGRALLDRPGGAPPADDVTLRDVAAGTHLRIGWSAVADTCGDADPVVRCGVVADDAPVRCAERTVVVASYEPFALRAPGDAYAVDAPMATAFSVAPSHRLAEPLSLDDIDVLALPDASSRRSAASGALREAAATAALTAEEGAALRRDLRAADGAGLAAHLVTLRALLPDAPAHLPADAETGARYAAFRAAQIDVLDRLFVKLRIPGFAVTAADVEDRALRDASVALHAALDATSSDEARLAGATLGAPDALRAQLALIARNAAGDLHVASAVSGYAAALDATLLRYAGAPLELFDCALAAPAGEALEAARRALLAACDAALDEAQAYVADGVR